MIKCIPIYGGKFAFVALVPSVLFVVVDVMLALPVFVESTAVPPVAPFTNRPLPPPPPVASVFIT
jgi:hypothetical protein